MSANKYSWAAGVQVDGLGYVDGEKTRVVGSSRQGIRGSAAPTPVRVTVYWHGWNTFSQRGYATLHNKFFDYIPLLVTEPLVLDVIGVQTKKYYTVDCVSLSASVLPELSQEDARILTEVVQRVMDREIAPIVTRSFMRDLIDTPQERY